MSEIDEAWAQALVEAERRARNEGRGDITKYLALRNSNDLLRQTGVSWLIETFTLLAAQANRSGAGIQTSLDDQHRFKVGNSTMVGRLFTMRNGVRTLFVEAGWPRVPADGFVAGGGLARGMIRHLGFKSADAELLLVKTNTGTPKWIVLDHRGTQTDLHESSVREQIRILLDARRTR